MCVCLAYNVKEILQNIKTHSWKFQVFLDHLSLLLAQFDYKGIRGIFAKNFAQCES